MGELDELFPKPWIFIDIIGGIAPRFFTVFHARRPVVATMPIRLGKICANAQPFCTKCPKHAFHNVRVRVLMERTTRCSRFIIRLLRIPQTKSVMVFRGENQILKAAVRRDFRPPFRLYTNRVKRTVQREIFLTKIFPILCPVNSLA